MALIYLSSTYEDLKDFNRAVIDVLEDAGHDVIAMERYVASDQRPVEQCLKDVERARIYVGLFGFRYGYIPPVEESNPDGYSITELEFRHAERLHKPCLVFTAAKQAEISRKFTDIWTGEGQGGESITQLREYVQTEKFAQEFRDPHELSSLVLTAVTECIHDLRSCNLLSGNGERGVIDWPGGRSPYPGLMAFDQTYAPVYCGRDQEVDAVLAKLKESSGRFLVITGAPGVGKSSLVGAGIWRVFQEEERFTGSHPWRWLRIQPGDGNRVFDALALGLKQIFPDIASQFVDLANDLASSRQTVSDVVLPFLTTGQKLVVFLDQLEELFTKEFTREDILKFLDSLVTSTQHQSSHLLVIATIRNEYIGDLLESEPLRAVFNSGGNYHLGLVAPAHLQEMIEGPAKATGYYFVSGLVEQMLEEAKQEPGSLPLVAYVLNQLFELRVERSFSRKAYQVIGGITGALGKQAEKAFQGLDETTKEAFDTVFAELIHVERDRPPTRKRCRIASLQGHSSASQFIEALADPGCGILVTGGDPTNTWVEVAHETLFSAWPRLGEWIGDFGESLRLIEYGEEAAQHWHDTGASIREFWVKKRADMVQLALERVKGRPSDTLEKCIRPQQMFLERLANDSLRREDRILIEKKLAEFGDPRPGVGLNEDGLPDILWVDIPPGTVTLKESKLTYTVQAFKIARRPITNIQFEAFLQADDGYGNDEWWEGLYRTESATQDWIDRSSPHGICEPSLWFDAVAFCRWLSSPDRVIPSPSYRVGVVASS